MTNKEQLHLFKNYSIKAGEQNEMCIRDSCSTDEVSYYLGLGFFVWYTGNKDIIDDKECRVFAVSYTHLTQIDEKLQISVHVMSSTDIHNFLKERPELLIQQEEEQELSLIHISVFILECIVHGSFI